MLKFSKKLLSLTLVTTLFLGVSALAAYAEDIIYYVKTGDTLFKLSTRFNVPINTIKQANNLKGDMLVWNQRLYIPGAPGFWNYTVRPGDTIYLIAQRFGVDASEIQMANNNWSAIYPGQVIVIPQGRRAPQTPAPPAGGQIYTVRYGDSLYLISQRFGVAIGDLRAANNLWNDNLMVGQQLVIPAANSKPQPPTGGQVYTVRYGDSLYLISKRFGVTIGDLRTANSLWNYNLMVGQQLVIPSANSQPSPQPQPPTGAISLRNDEIDLLARLVTAESAGEPYEGQVAVAATILNRMRSPNYPHSVREIIYQVVDGRYYQFSPVLDGRINTPATASAFKAVQDALSGWDPSNGAIGFYNPRKTGNQWVASQPVTTVIGNHVFFRE